MACLSCLSCIQFYHTKSQECASSQYFNFLCMKLNLKCNIYYHRCLEVMPFYPASSSSPSADAMRIVRLCLQVFLLTVDCICVRANERIGKMSSIVGITLFVAFTSDRTFVFFVSNEKYTALRIIVFYDGFNNYCILYFILVNLFACLLVGCSTRKRQCLRI